MARLKAGQIGALATDYVEGKVQLDGAMRDVMQTMAWLLPGNPATLADPWWRHLLKQVRPRKAHTPADDSAQVQFHYDMCDAFYALWLDPRRVYSCAYYQNAGEEPATLMTLASAQEAKHLLVRSTNPVQAEKTLRAYRLYLAGSAMGFEEGWMSLHQLLAARPTGQVNSPGSRHGMRGAQSVYPFNRSYM